MLPCTVPPHPLAQHFELIQLVPRLVAFVPPEIIHPVVSCTHHTVKCLHAFVSVPPQVSILSTQPGDVARAEAVEVVGNFVHSPSIHRHEKMERFVTHRC